MSPLASAAVASAPIFLILILMIIFRWSAAKAGSAGFVLTLVLAWLVFGFGVETYPELGRAGATSGALVEAVFTALTILWIIFPALCIYHLQVITGSIDTMQEALRRISTDPRIIAIIVAWFFALFMEGAAGFGTPIALTAPILVAVGFSPVSAVTLAMVGHAIGVSFGAVGTPILPQIAATGFSGLEIARATGIYHALLGWIMAVALMVLASRSLTDDVPERRVWPWVIGAALLFIAPMFAMSRWVGPELPTMVGALAGGTCFILLLRVYQHYFDIRAIDEAVESLRRRKIFRAAAPYLILVLIILVTRLVPFIQNWTTGLEWEWTLFESFRGSIQPLYHPGTLLFISFLAGAVMVGAGKGAAGQAMFRAARQVAPVTVALIAMLGLSRLMVHSGMIEMMAEAAAVSAGGAWPILAPLVGVLGTFVTGSATASNILFTDFQATTASTLELPQLNMLGAQGFGAAVGNIICPHNIIAGGATVGLAGQEGAVLRRTIGVCLLYAIAGGVLVWLMV